MDRLIGENAARVRVERGLSQEAVAEGMRVRNAEHRWSQATVWSIEKGDRSLKASEILDLSKVLETGALIFTHPEQVGPAIVDLNGRIRDLQGALVKVLAGVEGIQTASHRLRTFLGDIADRNGTTRVDAFTPDEWGRVEPYVEDGKQVLGLAKDLDDAVGEALRTASARLKALRDG